MKRLKRDTTDMLIMVKFPGFAICFGSKSRALVDSEILLVF